MKEMPLVSVLIINWNGLVDSIEMLKSFEKVKYKNYNIVLYDNGSNEDEAIILQKKFKKNLDINSIRSNINWGYDEGCNNAVKYAKKKFDPDYFLIMNNDVIVDPLFINKMVHECEKDKKIGGASPRIYYYNKPKEIWWKGKIIYNNWTGKLKFDKKTSITSKTDELTGCCMLIKKGVFEKVGYLNPKFFLSGYDTLEYTLRMKEKGFESLYIPSSKIWHKCGVSAWKLNPKERLKHEIIGVLAFLKIIKWYHLPAVSVFTIYGIIRVKIKGLFIFFFNKKKRKKFIKTFKN